MDEDNIHHLPPRRHRPQPAAVFPSRGHEARLSEIITNRLTGGYDSLSDEDKQFWHAYVYGFRRVLLKDLSDTSPPDQNGQWFNTALVDAAEDYYRQRYGRRA